MNVQLKGKILHKNQNENVNNDWIWGLAVTIDMFKDT